MVWNFDFFFTSIMLGVALAMDAFSVSLANGLREPKMPVRRMCLVAGIFSLFQFAMPMIGWVCVHTLRELFDGFAKAIPFIALVLLCYIGGKMLYDSIKNKCEEEDGCCGAVCLSALLLQGVATSIDALSVGFTISDHDTLHALVACLVIGLVTFFICFGGILIGKTFGTKLANKAGILGGCILIVIGFKIFIDGLIAMLQA